MGVWIETVGLITNWPSIRASHPAWVCGLKHGKSVGIHLEPGSHPAWVCGLKHPAIVPIRQVTEVTPCVGVWIETEIKIGRENLLKSHPAWVCGLKPSD